MGTLLAKGKERRMFGAGIKLGAGGLIVSAMAAASSSTDWHDLVKDFGFPVALVVFFVWASWTREERAERNAIEREQRIASRVTELEKFNQSELLDLNKGAAKAIADNTAALHRLASENTAAMTRLVDALENRPCLAEGTRLMDAINLMAKKVDSVIAATENGNA